MIEKFSDTETMEKSYENLEKEFTKKCQELSQLKKEFAKLQEENCMRDAEDAVNNGKEENCMRDALGRCPDENKDENYMRDALGCRPDENKVENRENAVPYNMEFRAKAGEFLRKNEGAKEFSKEISKVLLADPSLLNCSDPFAVAYALVLKDKKPEVKKDPVKTEEILDLPPQKPSIPVISKEMVGFVPGKVKPKFSSLEDARTELINRYFS